MKGVLDRRLFARLRWGMGGLGNERLGPGGGKAARGKGVVIACAVASEGGVVRSWEG